MAGSWRHGSSNTTKLAWATAARTRAGGLSGWHLWLSLHPQSQITGSPVRSDCDPDHLSSESARAI